MSVWVCSNRCVPTGVRLAEHWPLVFLSLQELEKLEVERIEWIQQHLCQYTTLRHETDMFNQSVSHFRVLWRWFSDVLTPPDLLRWEDADVWASLCVSRWWNQWTSCCRTWTRAKTESCGWRRTKPARSDPWTWTYRGVLTWDQSITTRPRRLGVTLIQGQCVLRRRWARFSLTGGGNGVCVQENSDSMVLLIVSIICRLSVVTFSVWLQIRFLIFILDTDTEAYQRLWANDLFSYVAGSFLVEPHVFEYPAFYPVEPCFFGVVCSHFMPPSCAKITDITYSGAF